jgi:hypothetical protein
MATRRTVENPEYAAFIRRSLGAYARRVAAGDIEALPDLLNLSTCLDQVIQDAVNGLRTFGYSWADIADRIGTTRQAAQQRWGNQPDRNSHTGG